jgi:CheY-like chemotaxis protein
MINFPEDLPLGRAAAMEESHQIRRPAKKLRSGSGSRKVWILDDDEVMCTLLLEQFRMIGWSLQAFHRPLLLLESLQAVQPDLLILDMCLPDKHGIEVLSRVRHLGQGFPILILSALAAPSDRAASVCFAATDRSLTPAFRLPRPPSWPIRSRGAAISWAPCVLR